jgi:ribosomal protein S18 acetylase RimI-like enzyme
MNRTPVAAPQQGGLAQVVGLVREAREDDADRIREFVCGLSPRSQYFRFFASVSPPSTSLLRALCGRRDGAGAHSVDILILTDSGGRVIGHGMAADVPGQGELASNIGLVIADSWQQQGLGTLLLAMLVSRAARRGVCSLVLDVLPANDRMLGIIERRWPDAPRERTRDAIIIRPRITRQLSHAEPKVPAVIGLSQQRYQGVRRGPGRPAA